MFWCQLQRVVRRVVDFVLSRPDLVALVAKFLEMGSGRVVRGRPYMTSAKFSGFWTPPSPLSAFGTDLQY